MIELRRITPEDVDRIRRFWREHWAGEEIIVHGEIIRPEQVEGFVSEDWTGLATYVVCADGCEIITLDAVTEGRGIGTALIEAVVEEAGRRGCKRVFLSTTNDNLHALGFYQRRGFQLTAIRCGAVADSRLRKPAIPLIGDNDIPLRDEIELQLPLPAAEIPRRGD